MCKHEIKGQCCHGTARILHYREHGGKCILKGGEVVCVYKYLGGGNK